MALVASRQVHLKTARASRQPVWQGLLSFVALQAPSEFRERPGGESTSHCACLGFFSIQVGSTHLNKLLYFMEQTQCLSHKARCARIYRFGYRQRFQAIGSLSEHRYWPRRSFAAKLLDDTVPVVASGPAGFAFDQIIIYFPFSSQLTILH